MSGYLSAAEVTQELGISVSTLYSYVSRGLLRSEFADRSKRTRRYPAEDVQRLKERQEMRRNPQKVVDTALHWGTPMLDSALTLIDGGRFYYRGRDALDLALRESVERVAAWFWLGEEREAGALFAQGADTLPPRVEAMQAHLAEATPMERFQALLPVMALEDPAAYDFRPRQAAYTGARILQSMTLLALPTALKRRSEIRNPPSRVSPILNGVREGGLCVSDRGFIPDGIAARLQRAWVPGPPQAAALLNAALILCADHELNVSSFTARCVASAGSPPYAVVSAGLAALQGVKHGGASDHLEALFREAGRPEQARAALAQRLRRGENIPGFGHKLYPEGDPRGRLLLEQVTAAYPQAPGTLLALALAEAGEALLHERPNLDFGLATLCAALDLPTGAAIALFALGRTIGWTGHAIEEYQADRLIRPRAHYTGVLPAP
ncbi:MAG TPA: citrate synthase family protein [Chthonomonadaceae bacterium]|nr:citrate synthase family protein [Chthonomonadaceae bacterium]